MKIVDHITYFEHNPAGYTGVTCRIRKITYQARLTLLRSIRELARDYEFMAAGESLRERYDTAVIQQEINHRYWQHFVEAVSGLLIDGEPATPESLWSQGPDGLVQEILQVIFARTFLTRDDSKN